MDESTDFPTHRYRINFLSFNEGIFTFVIIVHSNHNVNGEGKFYSINEKGTRYLSLLYTTGVKVNNVSLFKEKYAYIRIALVV